jgi:hypothetical protein
MRASARVQQALAAQHGHGPHHEEGRWDVAPKQQIVSPHEVIDPAPRAARVVLELNARDPVRWEVQVENLRVEDGKTVVDRFLIPKKSVKCGPG